MFYCTFLSLYKSSQVEVVVKAQRTSDKCRELNGKVFHVDDPIWNIIYPPNHWGCRSTVRQVRGRKIMDSSTADTSIVQKGFRHNLAKDGQIHPDESGYFNAVSKSELDKLGNPAYKQVERPGRKGEVFKSGIDINEPVSLSDNIIEAKRRFKAADALANKLDLVFLITPEIKYNDIRYQFYFKGAAHQKSPDLFGGGEYWDVGIYGRKVFTKAGNQANNIAIIADGEDYEKVKKDIENRLKGKSKFAREAKQVYIIYNGEAIKVR